MKVRVKSDVVDNIIELICKTMEISNISYIQPKEM